MGRANGLMLRQMQYLKTVPQGEKQGLDVEVVIGKEEGIPGTETMSNMAPPKVSGDGCKQVQRLDASMGSDTMSMTENQQQLHQNRPSLPPDSTDIPNHIIRAIDDPLSRQFVSKQRKSIGLHKEDWDRNKVPPKLAGAMCCSPLQTISAARYRQARAWVNIYMGMRIGNGHKLPPSPAGAMFGSPLQTTTSTAQHRQRGDYARSG